MPSAADFPAGRVGNYRCPFCNHTERREEDMILHRSTSEECIEKNRALREGLTETVVGNG